MSLTRIYLPLNAARLRELASSRVLGPGPLPAHGVTGSIRAGDPNGDQEGWEYVALGEAAEASAASLPSGERRRVVAAADVDDSWVSRRRRGRGGVRRHGVAAGADAAHRLLPRGREGRRGRRRAAVVRRHRAGSTARPALTPAASRTPVACDAVALGRPLSHTATGVGQRACAASQGSTSAW